VSDNSDASSRRVRQRCGARLRNVGRTRCLADHNTRFFLLTVRSGLWEGRARGSASLTDGKRRRVPVREEVRHALIALLASEQEGIHAYELDRRLRVLSEGFWTPYSGEVSRTLHQLEHEGDISSQWQMEEGRPKRVFTAARHGVERLDAWLHAEITADPRPLHEKLWHRFVAHRARKRNPAEMVRDIRIRRATSLEQLRRLEERLAATTGTEAHAAFARVALRIRQFEWQSELGILDELERELANDGKADPLSQATTDPIDRAEESAQGDCHAEKREQPPRRKERALA